MPNANTLILRAILLTMMSITMTGVSALDLTWVGCGITRNAFMADLAAAYQQKTDTRITIEGGGATKGIRAIAAKEADIGGACRYTLKKTPQEIGVKMIPVAWDALVVVVHKDNPLESISLAQLRNLYRGRIDNFSRLGGDDQPLELLIREGKISGVGYSLRKHLFEDPTVEFVSPHVFPSSGPLEKAVEQNPRAIAVTGVASAYKRDFKILKLEGLDPSFENIRTGNYLMYRPLFLVFNPNGPHPQEADRFIQFALSAEGREVIRKNRVVPYFDGMLLIQRRLDEWKQFIHKALADQPE